MAKASNNDGSLYEVQGGRHKGKFRLKYSVETPTGFKQRLPRLFPTKTAGKEFLRSLQQGAKVEAARQARELTLGEWFDWLTENDWPEAIDELTIAARKRRFNKYVRGVFGAIPLSRIDPMRVKALYKELLQKGTGKATLVEIRCDLVRVFNQAV
jgi:hypothetical protein